MPDSDELDRRALDDSRGRSPSDVVATLRATFATGRTRGAGWRRSQLRAFGQLMSGGGEQLAAALATDLRKHRTEARLTELSIVADEIKFTLAHLDEWLAGRPVKVPATLLPARAEVRPEPLGVVLVISPWNYPVQLALVPIIGALAAGNAVVLKPSELAPATSAALADLLPRYLDPAAVAVVEGGSQETTELLGCGLDHVFFTGSTRVGKIIMGEAAKTLTPVTLELGGKSPTFVDGSVDLATAADRIAWGKFVNAGQTCVAPDYVLATPDVAAHLPGLIADSLIKLYGDDPAVSADYGRIINRDQFDRLVPLLESGRPVVGGRHNADELYFAPTVLADVEPDAPVMAEEIFGPILPILTVADHDAAIAFVNHRAKPLVSYVFSDDPAVRTAFTEQTSSGALNFDIPLAHLLVPRLPFGGVGASGLGSYHGQHSFDTFSHQKSILTKELGPDTMKIVYPPFGRAKSWLLDRIFPS